MSQSRKTKKQLYSEIDSDLKAFQNEYIQRLRTETPVRSGAAKRAWRKVATLKLGESRPVIENRVGYAAILEQGSSRQAPRGMTRPAFRNTRKK